MNTTIDNDLEILSKKLYLESPDIWIEFLGKVGENIIDEMILFFAIKYNMPTIIKFAIDNDKLNLDAPSKNNTYDSIRAHLLATSKQFACDEATKLLSNTYDANLAKDNIYPSNIKDIDESTNTNIPQVICENCKYNILEFGYRIISNTIHKFSSSENRLIEVQDSTPNKVICNSCNNILENITLDKIKSICEIQSCNSCGVDLTNIGLLDNSRLEYNKDTNSFTLKSTNYVCSNCKNSISEVQKSYFTL